MLRLTREVRFAIHTPADLPARQPAVNGYAGAPPLTGLGYFFTLQLTVAGEPEPHSNYLINIKRLDDRVRQHGVELMKSLIGEGRFGSGAPAALELFRVLREGWERVTLERLCLSLSPFLSLSVLASEYPMVRLSQKFEFAASHRLHNPALSEEENRRTFGKCNNPHGHGHNYELEVTLAGQADSRGVLMEVPELERIVNDTVIERFDHKNLNVETAEFAQVIPSVENIAQVIYRLLKPRLAGPRVRLAGVTVWETPKTWCEYEE